jgi:hypothetical protein
MSAANDLAETLATIADEIANAKAGADAVIEDFSTAYDELMNGVAERTVAMAKLDIEINKYEQEAKNESDDKKKA